jgi:hypothetical protein
LGLYRQEDRVHEQCGQVDVVEVAALEGLKALTELLTNPRGGRLRELPEACLIAQRLDVAHRQAPDERADHHRPQGLGAQELRSPREEL